MTYKCYKALVTYDEIERLFYGRVIGIQDVIIFQGTMIDELEQAVKILLMSI